MKFTIPALAAVIFSACIVAESHHHHPVALAPIAEVRHEDVIDVPVALELEGIETPL